MGSRSTALADEFQRAVAEFTDAVESCSDAKWRAICNAEGWSVGQTAQHVSGQFPLEMEYITAIAEGKPLPAYSWDDINGKNDGRAGRNASVTQADVLEELRTGAASTGAYVRALSDEQLDRTAPLALADGAMVSTQQLIEGGLLIDHVRGISEASDRRAKARAAEPTNGEA
ncbi:MAG: DinB family protein [Chloroflexi bacterium]|nr:DinB family protein [Chloroflexota bacterium]